MWQDLRANWVNGNLGDCLQRVRKVRRCVLIRMVIEALEADRATRSGTHSGDCDDLLEILRYHQSKFGSK